MHRAGVIVSLFHCFCFLNSSRNHHRVTRTHMMAYHVMQSSLLRRCLRESLNRYAVAYRLEFDAWCASCSDLWSVLGITENDRHIAWSMAGRSSRRLLSARRLINCDERLPSPLFAKHLGWARFFDHHPHLPLSSAATLQCSFHFL